ncbi:MAG: heavy metal translocating P-type ATPase [Burkholderiaceae bacterium]
MRLHPEGIDPDSISQSSPGRPAPGASSTLSMRVEGMDCASCVGKIETALVRLPGVSDVQLNFATQSLRLSLATGSTRRSTVEETIRNLGFEASASPGPEAACATAPDSGIDAPMASEPTRWWQTRKGRQVAGLGLGMGIAYAGSLAIPAHGAWILAAAVLAGVLPFARKAVALARAGSPFSIEMLMSVAVLGALVIGEAEEAAAVVFLFALGELLESVAAGRARAGIQALVALVPRTATLLDGHGGQRVVPAAALRIGDRVLVRPGDRVSADGVIIEGASSLDESPVTGESIPIARAGGESVFAGSINLDGALQLRVERTTADNTISRIVHLVEKAHASRAPTARFIERFSRHYTPAVMTIAALVMLVPPLVLGGDWGEWLYRGLALLLIACPCALVLSTPAAIASGLAVGARHGLLVKGGHALETIGRVASIAFDKTGTLTAGRPRVTDVLAFARDSENEVLSLAASVESGSGHPLARAIVAHAESAGVDIPAATQARATAGEAAHAIVAERPLAIGSPVYAARMKALPDAQKPVIEALQQEGKTVSVLLDEGTGAAIGLVALRDEPRPDAREAIARLDAMGVRSIMLTGDNHRTARAIADRLGMDWAAELLPEDKLRLIDTMKQDGMIAMVGDGINDAPALAAADVGIAMGGGTDVALETADAALLKTRVTDVARLVALSRATMANIHQNVFFALGLKGVFLVTTILGITGLWIAVLADTGATALVTLNALRLLRLRRLAAAPEAGHG